MSTLSAAGRPAIARLGTATAIREIATDRGDWRMGSEMEDSLSYTRTRDISGSKR